MESSNDQRRAKEAFRQIGKREGAAAVIFGGVLLAICYHLASGDVPILRQGRLLVGFALGGAAVVAGVARWLNPMAFRNMIGF